MEIAITAIEMRRKFGGILDRVAEKGEHITILRGNRPLATLIPAAEHEKNCSNQDRVRTVQEVLAGLEEWQKKHPEKVHKMKNKNVTDVIRSMRDTRRP